MTSSIDHRAPREARYRDNEGWKRERRGGERNPIHFPATPAHDARGRRGEGEGRAHGGGDLPAQPPEADRLTGLSRSRQIRWSRGFDSICRNFDATLTSNCFTGISGETSGREGERVRRPSNGRSGHGREGGGGSPLRLSPLCPFPPFPSCRRHAILQSLGLWQRKRRQGGAREGVGGKKGRNEGCPSLSGLRSISPDERMTRNFRGTCDRQDCERKLVRYVRQIRVTLARTAHPCDSVADEPSKFPADKVQAMSLIISRR